MTRAFRGERDGNGARVLLDDELLAPDTPLWHTSLCLRNHSPSGPEWGYPGSAPGQLALVMLLAVTDTAEAELYYPLFRSGVLALIQGDRWTLPVAELRRWLDFVRGKDRQIFSVSGEPDQDGVFAVRIVGLDPDSPRARHSSRRAIPRTGPHRPSDKDDYRNIEKE